MSRTGSVEELGLDSLQFDEEIDKLLSVPLESGSSFTALLELPTNKAVKLLHAPELHFESLKPYHFTPIFPSNVALIDRASKFSVFASFDTSPEASSIPLNLRNNQDQVKEEPVYSYSQPNSSPVSSDPLVLTTNQRSAKRKEREKKVNRSSKKCKNVANETLIDAENLPYVHVRARRGQATDSHSLAERARREKINARMKLLQELVPGCTKISGTAMVLDEIINHVHSLQRQVELLSMRLATVNPRINLNLDNLLPTEGMFLPPFELEVNGQQYHQMWHTDGLHQPFTLDNSVNLGFDSSGSMHSNQLKMEL